MCAYFTPQAVRYTLDVNHPPILLGTSSFTASGWEEAFYPKGMRSADYLAFYANLNADSGAARKILSRSALRTSKGKEHPRNLRALIGVEVRATGRSSWR